MVAPLPKRNAAPVPAKQSSERRGNKRKEGGLANEGMHMDVLDSSQRQLIIFDFAPRERQALGLVAMDGGNLVGTCPPALAPNSFGERTAVADNHETVDPRHT